MLGDTPLPKVAALHLYRVERIDALFNTYATTIGESVGVETGQGMDFGPGRRPAG